MSDLSQSVQVLLTARGVDLKGNTDDLMTMINQGVIKAEKVARREVLESWTNCLKPGLSMINQIYKENE